MLAVVKLLDASNQLSFIILDCWNDFPVTRKILAMSHKGLSQDRACTPHNSSTRQTCTCKWPLG